MKNEAAAAAVTAATARLKNPLQQRADLLPIYKCRTET